MVKDCRGRNNQTRPGKTRNQALRGAKAPIIEAPASRLKSVFNQPPFAKLSTLVTRLAIIPLDHQAFQEGLNGYSKSYDYRLRQF